MFVALDIPEPTRAAIAAWQQRALGDPALRAVSAQALHLTLCFIGELAEARAGAVSSAVRAIGPRPVELRLDPLPAPLPRGRPALYAVAARSPAAVALQAELSRALASIGAYEPERRAFWPHLTVARVRSQRRRPEPGQRRGKSRPRRVAEPPGRLPDGLLEPFGAVRIAVYRSNPKPQGAEYVRLDGIDLPPP